MKAVRFHAHGGPEVLTYEDAPEPVAGPGEAVVRVRACGLNHLDLFQRQGIERVAIRFPHISGADIAGEVAIAPDGDFVQGRRVMLQPGILITAFLIAVVTATLSSILPALKASRLKIVDALGHI